MGSYDLTGVSCDLTAFHTDEVMDEGRHAHTWTVTTWYPAEPFRDGRALRAALVTLLAAWEGKDLPPELWRAEDLAAAVGSLLGCTRVNIDRPGFHAEVWL